MPQPIRRQPDAPRREPHLSSAPRSPPLQEHPQPQPQDQGGATKTRRIAWLLGEAALFVGGALALGNQAFAGGGPPPLLRTTTPHHRTLSPREMQMLGGLRAPLAQTATTGLRLAEGVFLSPAGHIVGGQADVKPANATATSEALFRAAQASEEGRNLFADPSIEHAQKRDLLRNLLAAHDAADARKEIMQAAIIDAQLSAVTPLGVLAPFSAATAVSQQQRVGAQTRASVPPLLLDLARSIRGTSPADVALRGEAFDAYASLLKAEPRGVLRDFMIYDLHRHRTELPPTLRARTDVWMEEVAPSRPPYASWFAKDNKTFRMEYHIGHEFWESEREFLRGKGFKETKNNDGTITMRMTIAATVMIDGKPQRVETPIELTAFQGTSQLLKNMGKKDLHVVSFGDHANYGRTVPGYVKDGPPDMAGDKVFLGLMCGGKGVHHSLRARYPELQLVQTKNSSWSGEDNPMLWNFINGIAHRQSWAEMKAHNEKTNSTNYYYPHDTHISKAAEDRDDDGKVDAWDRVLNLRVFTSSSAVRDELSPRAPGQPLSKLSGQALHLAVNRFHRMAGYNEWLVPHKNQGLLNAGFYEGRRTDPMFELTKVRGPAANDIWRVRQNHHYAHASEETLNAALHYEVGRRLLVDAGLSENDAKLAGLLMAAEALNVDNGDNDAVVFEALVKYAGLPSGITHADVLTATSANSTYPAGASSSLAALTKKLADLGIDIDP